MLVRLEFAYNIELFLQLRNYTDIGEHGEKEERMSLPNLTLSPPQFGGS